MQVGDRVFAVFHAGEGRFHVRQDRLLGVVRLHGVRLLRLKGQRVGCYGGPFVHRKREDANQHADQLNR